MTGFLKLLIQISKKRRLYIGNAGIDSLHHVRTGYEMCLKHNGIADDGEYKKFERFVFKSLGEPFGALSIWTMIANKTKDNDEAFDLLFALLIFFWCQRTQFRRSIRQYEKCSFQRNQWL